MGDRGAHIGIAQLGQHRTVAVLHHGMDHALGVQHDLDILGPGLKQPAGLHDLQPLVHHGGRVHRDLAAHDPVRMAAGLLGRDPGQLLRRQRAKGAAGGGQQDLFNAEPGRARAGIGEVKTGRQALEDRVMFAVDRQQFGPVVARRVHKQPARHDQGLLVGQQHALAGPGRGQGGQQSGRPDNGRHDIIHLGQRGHTRHICRPGQHGNLRGLLLQPSRKLQGGLLVRHHRILGAMFQALLKQPVHIGVGGQGQDPVAGGVAGRDRQRVDPDAAGGTQHGQRLQAGAPGKWAG